MDGVVCFVINHLGFQLLLAEFNLNDIVRGLF